MAKQRIAIYLGGGFVPGIPARDLTEEEVEQFGVANLKRSMIYKIMEVKHGNESSNQSSSG